MYLFIYFIIQLILVAAVTDVCKDLVNVETCTSFHKASIVNVNANESCVFSCKYNLKEKNSHPIKLTVKLNSSWKKSNIFISVQQQNAIHSWLLPIFFKDFGENQPYTTSENVFCPPKNITEETLLFRITSEANATLLFDLAPSPNGIKINEEKTTISSPVTPTLLTYQWNNNEESVLVEAHNGSQGDDNICALFSIQNAQCPYKVQEDAIIAGDGKYQTILSKGGLIANRYQFPDGLHIVVLPLPSNFMCTGMKEDSSNKSLRTKSVHITVKSHPTITEAWSKFLGMGFLLLVSVSALTFISHCLIVRTLKKHLSTGEEDEENLLNSNYFGNFRLRILMQVSGNQAPAHLLEGHDNMEEEEEEIGDSNQMEQPSNLQIIEPQEHYDDRIIPQNSLRLGNHFNPRYVNWWRTMELYRVINGENKTQEYGFQKNLIILGIFMALPFTELIYSYIQMYRGREDLCYFNSKCLVSWWIFPDFARVFSNIAYLFCAVAFLLILKSHKNCMKSIKERVPVDVVVGINHNYSFYDSLAYAMIIQSVMSSMYHICPNEVTLRFDMIFIYVSAMMLIVGTWGLRHHVISEQIYSNVGLIGVALLTAELQEWFPTSLFWITYGGLQIILCLITTYCIGRYRTWSFSPSSIYTLSKNWRPILEEMKGIATDEFFFSNKIRLLKASVGIILNVGLVIMGASLNLDVYKYVLIVCVAHALCYLLNYIINKFLLKEKFTITGCVSLLFCIATMIPAVVFFSMKNTDSMISPSSARLLNSECVFMGIFSYHDLWHIFSAFSLLFSFISILTLDDEMAVTPSEEINVF